MTTRNSNARRRAKVTFKIVLSGVIVLFSLLAAGLVKSLGEAYVGRIYSGAIVLNFFLIALCVPMLVVMWRCEGSVPRRIAAALSGTAAGVVSFPMFAILLTLAFKWMFTHPTAIQVANGLSFAQLVSAALSFFVTWHSAKFILESDVGAGSSIVPTVVSAPTQASASVPAAETETRNPETQVDCATSSVSASVPDTMRVPSDELQREPPKESGSQLETRLEELRRLHERELISDEVYIERQRELLRET